MVAEFDDPYGYAVDLLEQLEGEFSTPTLKEIAETYERMYNEPLRQAVASDVSGKYGKLIMGLCEFLIFILSALINLQSGILSFFHCLKWRTRRLVMLIISTLPVWALEPMMKSLLRSW